MCFFRLFVFLVFAFKYRRQVRSALGLERRQTCALDPRFNSKSNCTQGNRVTSIGLHKKEFSVMCPSNRGGEAFRKVGVGGGGAGAHQRVFCTRVSLFKETNKGETAVHGCHCPNLTTALLAQLGERWSAERVVRYHRRISL